MILPAYRLIELLESELLRLFPEGERAQDVSVLNASLMALKLLYKRELTGGDLVQKQVASLKMTLEIVKDFLPEDIEREVPALREVNARLEDIEAMTALTDQEVAWCGILELLELVLDEVRHTTDLPIQVWAKIVGAITEWEIDDLSGQYAKEPFPKAETDVLNSASLEYYLRDRFDDPELRVESFQVLAGGFGKETYLFTARSAALHGDFVLRRDFPVPLVDNDCHRTDKEFPVIRALYERGFPAPDALWLDKEHRVLPGGNFIVMRRSPGTGGGSVIKANTRVPVDLAETLADILARLHTLPEMEELGDLNESINSGRWGTPLQQVVREYLEGWMDIVKRSPHMPSPALRGMLHWLLDNIPEMDGQPVLLHGDIGFHNFLFAENRLSAVLDWEFAHLGDPAEDLATVRSNLGDSLDWPFFMAAYRRRGGADVDMGRIRFYQVWGYVRNALCSCLAAQVFIDRYADDMRFVLTPHIYMPYFMAQAKALIDEIVVA